MTPSVARANHLTSRLLPLKPAGLEQRNEKLDGVMAGQDNHHRKAESRNSSGQASSSRQTFGNETAIKNMVERIVLADITAISSKDVDPTTSPIMHNKHPNFRAVLPGLQLPDSLSYYKATAAEVCRAYQIATASHPNYQIKILEISTTVDPSGSSATVFCNVETSGLFDGLTRESLTIFQAIEYGDRWVLTDMSVLVGLGGLET